VERVLRSKKLRNVLFNAADGKCQICGRELDPDDWHADHIVPWSVSGTTNVHEMQALCPDCNLNKGNSNMILRSHQKEAVDIAGSVATGSDIRQVLIHVVPGGGKSWIPPLVLDQMPSDYKLGWFVPRISLRDQAESGCHEDFGLEIRGSGNDQNPARDSRGFVTTHAALTENPSLWMREMERSKYVVVIDECHHAKRSRDESTNQLYAAINKLPYDLLLLMTGTLETNDSTFIWGVNYAESEKGLVPDFSSSCDARIWYGRKKAIEEGAVIEVEFHHHDGPVRWETLEGKQNSRLSEATREQESGAIQTAIKTEIADAMLSECLIDWIERGEKMLVVAFNQDQAREIEKKLFRTHKTFLAISDNDRARDDIKRFKKTDRAILVTCQMAYEGLDDKRLTHGCCLTAIRSKPWIEQMLARLWRSAPQKDKCFWWVPDDPRMNRVICRIHDEDVAAIRDLKTCGNGSPGIDIVIPISSDVDAIRIAGMNGESVSTRPYHNETQDKLMEWAESQSIDTSSEEFAAFMESLKTKKSSDQYQTVSEREDILRTKIKKLCSRNDYGNGWEQSTTAKILKEKNNYKSTTDMGELELENALSKLKNLIAG